jgi:Uma2 family endonuclease
VEVADSTVRYDRTVKASLYASAGIEEYWVLALGARRLDVFRQPVPTEDQRFGWAYSSVTAIPAEGDVTPLAAPESAIRVADLLP